LKAVALKAIRVVGNTVELAFDFVDISSEIARSTIESPARTKMGRGEGTSSRTARTQKMKIIGKYVKNVKKAKRRQDAATSQETAARAAKAEIVDAAVAGMEEDLFVCLTADGRIDGTDPKMNTTFRCWDNALAAALAPSSSPAGKGEGDVARSLLDELQTDCVMASFPMSSATHWLPAGQEPRCSLERLAQSVFSLHTQRIDYDAAASGAEWWAQVRRSKSGEGEASQNASIGFHWDKDEASLRIMLNEISLYMVDM